MKVAGSWTDQNRLFEYFLATIKLYADLCFERNNIAMDVLRESYPFEIFLDIMRHG